MAAMKDCPSCHAEVPTSAKRCKECFHDFEEAPPSGNWAGPIALLISVAGMVIVALLTLTWIVMQPQDQHIFIDQDSQSVVFTKTFVSGTTTDRLNFSEVTSLEYVMHANGGYEIVAVKVDGSRRTIKEDDSPIVGDAKKYSQVMKKPLTTVDNTRGFGG